MPIFASLLGTKAIHSRGKYQSGQMGQTVNLLAYAFGGSNPSLPTSAAQHIMCWTADFFVAILKLQHMGGCATHGGTSLM